MISALFAFAGAIITMTDVGLSIHNITRSVSPHYPVSQHGFGFSSQQRHCSLNTSDILRSITVGVVTPSGSGSGVVIGRKGNLYSILTAKHVLSGIAGGETLEVYSPETKKYYRVIDTDLLGRSSADIALIRIESRDKLKIAALSSFYKAKPLGGVATDPLGMLWGVDTGGGRGAGISMPSGAITVPVLRYTEFTLQERAVGNKDGYEFIYQASTVPGMSGGPITGYRSSPGFGAFGLLAIHGRSEEYRSGGRSGTSLAVPVDIISEHLRKKSTEYGIPTTDLEIYNLIYSQYCG